MAAKIRGSSSGKLAKAPTPLPPFPLIITVFGMVVVLLWCGVLQAESIPDNTGGSLFASLDQNSAKVGSTVLLTLTYHLPEGAGLPENPEIKGLEGLTVIERSVASSQIRIKLLVDQLGQWKSGSLSLPYVNKAGETKTLTTDPVSLTVLSNLGKKPEEADLRALQGIILTKSWWVRYLPWGAGLLSLLLVGAGILLWWYQKRLAKKGVLGIVEDPPHVRARKEIEQLEATRLFEKGGIKMFYFIFSEILRHYLESIRGFPAAEFTTEEISHHVSQEVDRKLLLLLRQADLIKFADAVPTPVRKEEDIKSALSYIRETSTSPEKSERKETSWERTK